MKITNFQKGMLSGCSAGIAGTMFSIGYFVIGFIFAALCFMMIIIYDE